MRENDIVEQKCKVSKDCLRPCCFFMPAIVIIQIQKEEFESFVLQCNYVCRANTNITSNSYIQIADTH